MYNIDNLRCCRACGSLDVENIWTFPALPPHLWPLPDGVQSVPAKASVFVCNTCGHAQLNDMSVEFVEDLYRDGVFVFDEDGQQESRKAKVTGWAGKDFFADIRILELGGGNNPFLRVLPEARERWIADLNPQELANKTADQVIAGNFETIDLPEAYFDVICGFLTYEHFINPLAVTKRIAPALKDDGVLLVEVPNLHWLRSDLPHYMVFHQHISIFSMDSLTYMMAVAGLELHGILENDVNLYAAFSPKDRVSVHSDDAVIERAKREVRETGAILQAVPDFVATETPMLQWERPSLYGAGGSASLLLAYMPEFRSRISYAFDRDTRKLGRTVPGTDVLVQAPDAIGASDSDGALILTDGMRDSGIGAAFPANVTGTGLMRSVEKAAL